MNTFFLSTLNFFFFVLLFSCGNPKIQDQEKSLYVDHDLKNDSILNTHSTHQIQKIQEETLGFRIEILSHHINTSQNEYHPCPMPNGNLIFSAMDRTGYFDYQIDFTKTLKMGGEDIFISKNNNNLFEDARPFQNFNTNSHEIISQVIDENKFIGTGNYSENMGPASNDAGMATPDIFKFVIDGENKRVYHLEEPVNSIYGEFDPYMPNENTILFVSDRPCKNMEYHKKGWRWNNNFWGNTNVFVALKVGDSWLEPILLPLKINTPYAERSPCLSKDGLTLFLSSNGYEADSSGLNIYYFKRTDSSNWLDWEGPFLISDFKSEGDDWGLRWDSFGNYYFSRSGKRSFKSSMPATNGDGFIRETNYRAGYAVFGSPSAALHGDQQTDIFIARPPSKNH